MPSFYNFLKKGEKRMKKKLVFIVTLAITCLIAGTVHGNMVTTDLWIRAVINTVDKGPIDAVWVKGGEDTTTAGDKVVWGYFYANPADVSWGSQQNPELFVKIWFDRGGRTDVNYFHVSVPDIEVWSDYPYDGTADEHSTTTLDRRYIRHYYENGQSATDEQYEDGEAPSGYLPAGNPSGNTASGNLRIGALINTNEKGAIEAVWNKGGEGTTTGGHQVVWGHFYADPNDVTWGNENNPELFVKIWYDAGGRVDVNFFHVSVPSIEVYSDMPSDGAYNRRGTTIMSDRYIRHEYWPDGGRQSPTAKFTTSLSSDTLPLKVTLDASESYDPDGRIVKYQWTNSAEPGKIYEGMITEITVPDAGTYTFTLTITDNDSIQDMAQQTAEIRWPGTDPGSTEFEVREFALITESPPANCLTPPSPKTDFSNEDTKVIAWVRYGNFGSGKTYEFNWHSPDGSLAQTDTGSRENNFAEGCSWISIPTAKLQEYAPGQWTVAFHYDGQKYEEKTFNFSC